MRLELSKIICLIIIVLIIFKQMNINRLTGMYLCLDKKFKRSKQINETPVFNIYYLIGKMDQVYNTNTFFKDMI